MILLQKLFLPTVHQVEGTDRSLQLPLAAMNAGDSPYYLLPGAYMS